MAELNAKNISQVSCTEVDEVNGSKVPTDQLGTNSQEIKIFQTDMKNGIVATPAFATKKLAHFAVNVGTKCGHGCLYCSSGPLLRMHHSFKETGQNPFCNTGYAIVDPTTPERVAWDAKHKRNRGMVQICTTVDAWAPESQKLKLGRQCLEAILTQPDWSVRILTKNAAVMDDFDLIEKYRDRVILGLSITATEANSKIIRVIEPHASPIEDRIAVMRKAADMGLRTYGMFCPLLPGIADAPEQMDELMSLAQSWNVEEVFVEAVNPRGSGLRQTQEGLEKAGFTDIAKVIERIRHEKHWSPYVARLVANSQKSIRRYLSIDQLRYLLYTSGLLSEDIQSIRQDDVGVIWLDEETENSSK